MNVRELREALTEMPDDWTVVTGWHANEVVNLVHPTTAWTDEFKCDELAAVVYVGAR